MTKIIFNDNEEKPTPVEQSTGEVEQVDNDTREFYKELILEQHSAG